MVNQTKGRGVSVKGHEDTSVISSKSKNVKKDTGKSYRKWSPEENQKILDYMKDSLKKNYILEKPNAQRYYTRLIEKQDLRNCSPNLIKNKVRHFQKIYKEALAWRNQTGQGVKDTEGDASFQEIMKTKYPNFEDFDEIWGSKANVSIPYQATSSQIGPTVEDSVQNLEVQEETGDSNENQADIEIIEEDVETSRVVQASSKVLSTPKNRPESTSSKSIAKSSRDAYLEAMKFREESTRQKMLILQEELELRKRNMDMTAEIERDRLEFDKQRYLEDKQLKLRELEVKEKEIELESAKIKLEFAKLQNK